VGIATVLGDGLEPRVLADGYVQIGHWNPELDGWLVRKPYVHSPAFQQVLDEIHLYEYGVCDSIEQFQQKYGKALDDCMFRVAVFFTHVAKDLANAGRGRGWRWHKWGPYVGDGVPTREYLDDEPLFDDGVYTYHVYLVPRRFV
jgi:hypothetical protein